MLLEMTSIWEKILAMLLEQLDEENEVEGGETCLGSQNELGSQDDDKKYA